MSGLPLLLPADAAGQSSGVFEEVFTKRGDAEVSDCQPSGVFEEVFVRRGRWRKPMSAYLESDPKSHSNVLQLAEQVVSGCADIHFHAPTLLDTANTKLNVNESNLVTLDDSSTVERSVVVPQSPDTLLSDIFKSAQLQVSCTAQFVVKNTFIDTKTLDYDSLKEFLTERKVQSCPAGSVNIDEIIVTKDAEIIAESPLQEGIFNTESTFADFPGASEQQEMTVGLPSASTSCADTESAWKEAVFNTASTFKDGDYDGLQQRISEVACDADQVPCYYNTDYTCAGELHNPPTTFDDQRMVDDRLNSLRNRGSEIRHIIGQNTLEEPCQQQLAHVTLQELTNQQPTRIEYNHQWESMLDIGSWRDVPSEATFGLQTATPWHEASCVSVPPPPPPFEMAPAAPPVLRLAEALPLQASALPSVGSAMHHLGVCRPCTFFHTRGCENKDNCNFCHLCLPGEKKRRLRAQRLAKKGATLTRYLSATATQLDQEDFEDDDDMIVE